MFRRDDLETLAVGLSDHPGHRSLLERLRRRSAPLRDGRIGVPRRKALLSRDGGVCADDGTPLQFDPLSPDRHRCPRCGREWTGERHDLHWARAQHLWLAERSVDLSLLTVLTQDLEAGRAAHALFQAWGEVYFELPNRDNVLGPSHLFFSTYLESMWVTNVVTAAFVLREGSALSAEAEEEVSRVVDEAAGLIGLFVEGMSNRQTWHAAALSAIAAWFGDEELAATAIEARTGLLGHLADGFGPDGLWHEGENYHLFALRGLMHGLAWARAIGVDLLEDPELRDHFRTTLLAPPRTALPDFTYPARGDSRYGASLGQPAHLELWEIGQEWLGGDQELQAWLSALYAAPSPPPEHSDAWLHDAALDPPVPRTRSDLSWWVLTAPESEPDQVPLWRPESRLFPEHGLAILRQEDRYASLEVGPARGGHGHPDRLHLTLHAAGVHWLPDPGTGSYVDPSLAWYRSPLAHNAPILDGLNAGGADAEYVAFEERDGWGWVRGRAGELTRTVIAGSRFLVDLIELESPAARTLELPWHFTGEMRFELPGRLEPGTPLDGRSTTRFVPEAEGPLHLILEHGVTHLSAHLIAPGAEVLMGRSPGLPGQDGERGFLLLRGRQSATRWITVIDLAPPATDRPLGGVGFDGALLQIATESGEIRFRFDPAGLVVEEPAGSIRLAGIRAPSGRVARLGAGPLPAEHRFGWDAVARAPRSWDPPGLDGSLDGFDCTETISLAGEQHYRPSEEPFDLDQFAAQAWVNWDGEALYVAVEVTKSDLVIRAAGAPPLALDNEPDEIHADGLQIYLEYQDGEVAGWLVSLQPDGTLRGRGVSGTAGRGEDLAGSWSRTDDGYRVTFRVGANLADLGQDDVLGFDLIVNEMRPGRRRRAGQLVWSGGDGWVYLRGDRQSPSHFGRLRLG